MSESEQEKLRARLEAFLAVDAGCEVTEDGELLFELREAHFQMEEAHGKLLLHLWSRERNWVRRVLGIARQTAERLELSVERFGQRRPGKLVIAPPRRAAFDQGRSAARRRYCAWLRRLLEREFPRTKLEAVSTSPDLKRSFSALCTRARQRERERWWAVMGVNGGEETAAADALLTYALIWFDWNRGRYPDGVWAGLRLFLPQGRTQTTANRVACLDPAQMRVELFAVDEEAFACARLDARDFGNLESHLVPARRAEDILAAESSAVERIRALAPEAIESVVPAGRNELSLRFRGLEFARSAGGQVTFGVGRQEEPLTKESFSALAGLVERLRRERVAESASRGATPYYRMQAERWLESVVLSAPQALDARLAPGRLYRQVPAVAGGERGVADLLGATRDGQLVVIELKASTDIHLPLQGLDYWQRVRWHQERGELRASGYFSGLALKPDAPELLLVAPALQFHSTMEALVSYLVPEVPVTLVGINEDWRRELKVVFRRTRS